MRSYLFHFFVVAITTLCVLLILGLWLEPVHGDLTRTGHWSEKDFGTNLTQGGINVKANSQTQGGADIMVLGDSFSEQNIWQTLIHQRTSNAFKTYNYGNCVPNFLETAKSSSATKIVIIETIERDFLNRFNQIKPCTPHEATAYEIKEKFVDFQRAHWPPTLSIIYLARTAVNTLLLDIFPKKIWAGNNVVNAQIRDNCAKFSHRRHDRILYYQDDDLKNNWHEADVQSAVSNVLAIQQSMEKQGKKFIFVLVPDKSSVYAGCLVDKKFSKTALNTTNLLISAGVNTPNILSSFQKEMSTTPDLYEPNNTHWSLDGYQRASLMIQSQFSNFPQQ